MMCLRPAGDSLSGTQPKADEAAMKLVLREILCTVDMSPSTAELVDFAAALSSHYEATLVIFHALYKAPDTFSGTDELNLENAPATGHEEDVYRQLGAFMRGHHCPWRTVLAKGEPVEKAVRTAHTYGVDLAIARRHSLPAMRKIFRWTLIERLARQLEIPLLILPPAETSPRKIAYLSETFQRIMLACDLKPRGHRAHLLALGLAHDFAADLHLFHSLEAPVDEQLVNPTEAPYWQVQEALQEKLRQKLLALAEPLKHTPLKLVTELRPGPAAETICDYARSSGATLLVVGARHHGKLGKLLLGSTTETVLRNTPCAVLVVPDDTQDTTG